MRLKTLVLLSCLFVGCQSPPVIKHPDKSERRRDYFTLYKITVSKALLTEQYQWHYGQAKDTGDIIDAEYEARLMQWAKESSISHVTVVITSVFDLQISDDVDWKADLPSYTASGFPVNFQPSKSLLQICTIEPVEPTDSGDKNE